jgi:hypothetical protein
MLDLGMSRADIAAELGRRYKFRPRAAWRAAWGWTLEEAAARYNTLRSRDARDAVTSLTVSRLSEWENWPVGSRKPPVTALCLLADVYQCGVLDLIDLQDRQKLIAHELHALGKAGAVPAPSVCERAAGTNAGMPGMTPPGAALHHGSGAPSRSASGQHDDRGAFGLAVHARWPDLGLSLPLPDQGIDWLARFPTGRVLDTAGTIAVQVHPLRTAADGNSYLPVAGGRRLEQLAATTAQRGLLAGVEEGPAGVRVFGVNLREAHRRISQAPGVPSAVMVPRAYELDDLAYGIMWAVTSLDDALLADDAALDDCQQALREYDRLLQSAGDHHAAAGLTSAARMWLGSSFCARHILRNLAESRGLPLFWTREQTGEEACAWLLFRHKHSYLQQISGGFSGAADPLIRGFCIPEDMVAASPHWERILLLLSVALMESLGIRVNVCKEPAYSDVEGFVLLPGDRAIIATWVRAEGLWHADCVTDGTAVRGLADVTGHVTAHSVTGAATPGQRLMALASYLGLDWPWLWRRCSDLGEHGCAGLIQPRSRLLSTAGVDAAMRFAGAAGRAEP